MYTKPNSNTLRLFAVLKLLLLHTHILVKVDRIRHIISFYREKIRSISEKPIPDFR